MLPILLYLFLSAISGHQNRISDLSKTLSADIYRECQQSGNCYIFANKTLSWDQAIQTCNQFNGSVISINGPAENEWLASRIKALKFSGSFINAKYDSNLQSYLSNTGQLVEFINHRPEFEISMDKNHKEINIRKKRHTKIYKTVNKMRRVIVSRKIGEKQVIHVKYKQVRKVHQVHNIYKFKYRKFIKFYNQEKKLKLKLYEIIVTKRQKKIQEKKDKLLQIWITRIEWLKKQNWEVWFKTIQEINSEIWIKRIQKIIDIIEKKNIEKIQFIWNSWWTKIVSWYKDWIKQFSKKQIELIWRWKRFVIWLKKNSWENSIKEIKGIDHELWIGRIKRIIWIIEQRKYTNICDKDWTDWKTTIETWILMVNNKRKDILDDDKKRIAIEKWKKRVDWLKRNHIATLIKFGNALSEWKKKSLTFIEHLTDYTKNYQIESLLDNDLLKNWHEIKNQIEIDLTTGNKPAEVRDKLNWINRLHWLESSNIQFILQKNGENSEKSNYNNFITIVKQRNFTEGNIHKISDIFNHFKSLIEKQQESVIGGLNYFTVVRKTRSVVSYFDIPTSNSLKLDLQQFIKALKKLTTNYPLLENFLINQMIKLHYLATKFDESKIEPHKILFEKLIQDHLEILHRLKLPLNFWKLLSAVNLPSVSINLKQGDCLTMENNGRNPELWQQINCNKPRQFICQIKS